MGGLEGSSRRPASRKSSNPHNHGDRCGCSRTDRHLCRWNGKPDAARCDVAMSDYPPRTLRRLVRIYVYAPLHRTWRGPIDEGRIFFTGRPSTLARLRNPAMTVRATDPQAGRGEGRETSYNKVPSTSRSTFCRDLSRTASGRGLGGRRDGCSGGDGMVPRLQQA